MAFDVSNLSDYTKENSGILVAESIIKSPRTLGVVSIQTGVKSKDSINLIDQDITLQKGDCINSSAAGDDLTFSQRELAACPLTHYNEKCLDVLEDKWTSELMRPGSTNEEIPFEEMYSNYITSKIGKIVEEIAWQGDTNNSGNLGQCDGWLKQIENDGDATVITSGYSKSDALARVDELVDNLDEDAREKDDLTLFISRADFDTLTRAYRDANLFDTQYHATANADGTYMLPGYDNIRVLVAPGLAGSQKMVLTPASNLYFGTDMENEYEDFRIFYDEQLDKIIERVKFKIAFNHAFGSEVVELDHT